MIKDKGEIKSLLHTNKWKFIKSLQSRGQQPWNELLWIGEPLRARGHPFVRPWEPNHLRASLHPLPTHTKSYTSCHLK